MIRSSKSTFMFPNINSAISRLTHWSRLTHIYVSKLTIIGSDNGLSPGRLPSHYLNQCWNIVNWTIVNKLQWNLNRKFIYFHWRKCLWKCCLDVCTWWALHASFKSNKLDLEWIGLLVAELWSLQGDQRMNESINGLMDGDNSIFSFGQAGQNKLLIMN